MKRAILFAAIIVLGAGSSSARAAEHAAGGLGFRSNDIGAANASELRIDAPIGVRWWLNGQKLAIDLGVGVASHKDEAAGENTTDWSIDAGVPILIKGWDRAKVIFRPGINYASQEDFVPVSVVPPLTFEKITDKFTTVTGEIEAEVFLVDQVSISASEGIGWVNYKPGEAGGESTSAFTTFGRNFTRVGFHVYLWGSK
ncbi:MAG: hypothetical protein HYR73_00485 [Candidatus Eisenbacteria bacterium]|nr:hypothetical protein [Candidatus Eisenbacteria bacterium]